MIEVVGKVVFGFALVRVMAPHGLVWGAVAAILGVTIAELLALLFLMIRYHLGRDGRAAAAAPRAGNAPLGKDFYKRLFSIAIPVTIGASMMPIVNLVDASLVTNRLTHIGYALADAREMYGVLTGMVNTMVNMPAVITLSFSMSLVPAVSSAQRRGDHAALQRTTGTSLKLAFMIGSAAAVGQGLLAHQILRLLYASEPETAWSPAASC